MVLQIRGFKIPDAAVTTSLSSNCIIVVRRVLATGLSPAEFLSWKTVGRGGVCLHSSSRLHTTRRNWKTDFGPPRSCYVNMSTATLKGVPNDENDAAASACSCDSPMDTTLRSLKKAGIIACLRTTCTDTALKAARAALGGGLNVVEITMTTPSATEVIKCLVKEFPFATIGAGTVLSESDANKAKEAGAKFLTSPVTVEQMVREHRDGSVLFIPGAMTPTEVASARRMGAKAVKLFPMPSVGNIDFIRALSRTLLDIPLIPSSGITFDLMESYLKAGVMAVVLSDAVFQKDSLQQQKYENIKRLAKEAALRRSKV